MNAGRQSHVPEDGEEFSTAFRKLGKYAWSVG